MRRDDAKVLDLYAAALEIDCVDQAPVHNRIAEQLTKDWPRVHAPEPRSLEEAKLNLVHRFGEATRTIAERYPQGKQDSSAKRRKREQPNDTVRPAYRQLYRISYLESSDSIRAAGAQEIGAGGDEAFDMLEGLLGPRDDADSPDGQAAPHAREETTGKTGARPWSDNGGLAGGPPGAAWHMTQLNADGLTASEVPKIPPAGKELILRAWLAPLLAGSVTHRAGDARDNLEQWLQFVAEPDLARANSNRSMFLEVADLSLPLEVALAQGFKYAANRRQQHPHAQPEVRAYLLDQATEMLKDSRFWFSQLTLLHALCLLSLPDPDVAKPAGRLRTDHSTVVGRWAAMLRSPQHPFVIESSEIGHLGPGHRTA